MDGTQEMSELFDSFASGEMTNGAAIGYMILAAKDLELPHDSIRSLENLMLVKMDYYTEERAEREFRSF